MSIDLTSLNQKQLASLIKSAQVRKEQVSKQRIAVLRGKIQALLASQGVSLDDVLGRQTKPLKKRRTRRTQQ